jgi:Flp pilus assembly protein TadG
MNTMHADIAMLQAPTKKHAQSQKGNALVEFALILPIFLTLLFGMVTFSISLYDKTVLTMATREGARAGAKYVKNRTNSIITNSATAAASQVCQNNLISFGTGGMISPTISTTIQNNILTVTASYNYTGLFWDFIRYSSNINYTISAQNSMRLE